MTIRVGITVSGTLYSMGLVPKSTRPRRTARQLVDYAVEQGLGGVELPVRMIDDPDDIGRYAAAQGLFVTADTGGFEPEALARDLDVAARLGATTLRTLVGGAKIGGDRRPLRGRWQAFLDDVQTKLRIATKTAEELGVNLAVENHQDLASEELIWLCQSIDSPRLGITLDAGNPLATAEEPIDFFRRVAPHVMNVHLKDYWVWWSEEGYRLVRCPLGHGLVDVPLLLSILAVDAPDATLAIELAALEARHIRVFATDFWPDYPPRTAEQLAAALRVVQANARHDGDWRTPFERDESPDAIADYEQQQLDQSIAYVHTL